MEQWNFIHEGYCRFLTKSSDRNEEQIKFFEDKDYQNATLLDFLAVSEALGVEIIDGNFIAKMDEFYLKRLEAMRFSENMDAKLKAAS